MGCILATNIKNSFLPSSVPLRCHCRDSSPSIQHYPLSLLLLDQLTSCPLSSTHIVTVPLWTCPNHRSHARLALPPWHRTCDPPIFVAPKENLHILTSTDASCLFPALPPLNQTVWLISPFIRTLVLSFFQLKRTIHIYFQGQSVWTT